MNQKLHYYNYYRIKKSDQSIILLQSLINMMTLSFHSNELTEESMIICQEAMKGSLELFNKISIFDDNLNNAVVSLASSFIIINNTDQIFYVW